MSIDLFPHRNTFLTPDDLDFSKDILFHAMTITELRNKYIYNKWLNTYSVVICGVLKDGRRANLIISNIPLYFDIKLDHKDNKHEKDTIGDILTGKIHNTRWELVEKYPGVGYCHEPVTYMRWFFTSTYEREKALKEIRSSKNNYETASDYKDYEIISHTIIKYEWTFGDFSIVSNYKISKDRDRDIIILSINDPKDFIAVNRPLSDDKPLCQTPSVPIYFHLCYDIEVNGTTDALPTVSNRNETIFMLSGGVYRSDKPNVLLKGFTISHMKCMDNRYKQYLLSDRRKEFMENDLPEWDLYTTDSEEDTLLYFSKILGKIQPEFLSGFNSWSFDDIFVVTRIHQYGKLPQFIKNLSIVPFEYTFYYNFKLESMFKEVLKETKIKGDPHEYIVKRRLKYVGNINVDIMVAMKKIHSTENLMTGHALKNYLDRYGLSKKKDMSIYDMNVYYKIQDPNGLLEVADYCLVDALSLDRIATKVSLFERYFVLSHISLCQLSDSVLRADGHKVKNVIYCFGKRMNINYTENTHPETIRGEFPGAKVFSPIRGLYNKVPIIAIDYNSLYPSIMRACGISPDTYIDADNQRNRKLVEKLKELKYDIFEFSPHWTYKTKDICKEYSKKVCFVRKDPDGNNVRGAYTECLSFLTKFRQQYKAKLKNATKKVSLLENDPDKKDELFEAKLEENGYNQKQLAVKIIMNTVYGKTGSKEFNLYDPFIASTITLMGRKLITAAADISIDNGYKVIYGDSVTGNTPVILKLGNSVSIIRIDKVNNWMVGASWQNIEETNEGEEIEHDDGKEYCNDYHLSDLQVWSKDGWTKIRNIMRHKTTKRIIRVNTHCGLVDVTEDHSLLDEDDVVVKPDDIDNGSYLLHNNLEDLIPEFVSDRKSLTTKEAAWSYGFFMAEGSCGTYNCPSGKKSSWAVNNQSIELLERCQKGFSHTTKILDTMESSNVYKLVAIGDVKDIAGRFRRLFYNDYKEKIVPDHILKGDKEICQSFLEGFFAGDGCVKDNEKCGCNRFDQKGQETCLRLWILLKKCGYKNVSINSRSDKPDVFRLTYSNNPLRKPANQVKKKYTLCDGIEQYVYDLTTENGRFHAGIGEIIVHNTDSCFLLPSLELMKGVTEQTQMVKLCTELTERDLIPKILKETRNLTKTDVDIVKLSLDKMLYPFISVGKKKYAAIIFEGNKIPHLYVSGLEHIKRNTTQFVIDLSNEILDIILDPTCAETVLDVVVRIFKSGIDKLRKEPIDYFVKKGKYRPSKDSYLTQFINRMKEKEKLDPVLYETPNPSEVFEFVVTDQLDFKHNGTKKNLKIADKMEFKNIAKIKMDLSPDYDYYLNNTLSSLSRIICFHQQFNQFEEEDDTIIDQVSNENAKKYLRGIMKNKLGIDKVSHTIIKQQIRYINDQYHIQYIELLQYLQNSFDQNIGPEEICSFIIQLCENINPIRSMEYDNLSELIEEKKEFLRKREHKIKAIYSKYIGDMKYGLTNIVVDINMFNKSEIVSRSTKEILHNINWLRIYNGINKVIKLRTDFIMDALLSTFEKCE